VYQIFEQVVVLAKEYEFKVIYHLGDHFTSRQAQSLIVLLAFQRILNLLKANGITMITCHGNHDTTDQSLEQSYLSIFKGHSALMLIDGTVDELDTTPHLITVVRGVCLYMLPFFTDEVYNQKLSEIKTDPKYKNVLLTHIGLDGVLNNDGDKLHTEIPVGRFKAFDLTLIGHYHNYNRVTKSICYIGSTDPRNFGEDDVKGITILHDDLTLKQIKLKFKSYVKVVVNTIDVVKIAKLVEEHKSSEDNVRFVFNCTEEDYYKVDHEKIKSTGIDVQYNYRSKAGIVLNDDEEEHTEVEPTASVALTKADILKSWLDYSITNQLDSLYKNKGLKLIAKIK
jgi:exonuclease SbcD